MTQKISEVYRIALVAALGAALFILSSPIRAADTGFPIYFEDSKLIVKPETVNRVIYLPLMEIIHFLELPYTDAIALETLTIRGGKGRVLLTRNSGLISIDDQIVLLKNPILKENDTWLAPIDFLTQALARVTGIEFDHRPGTRRIFAGGSMPSELVMNAQVLGAITRLTIRAGTELNVEVHRDEQNRRAILLLGDNLLDPFRERLDYKDRRVQSIAFDDSDGKPKIVLQLTDEASEIKVAAAENNRILFVDLLRITETASAGPGAAPAPAPAAPPLPDVAPVNRVKVIVIDPGHGGLDSGANNGTIAEKDLTLAFARRLRTALQSRLGSTVLLTRDSDDAIDNQSRSAVANNNQANLLISLHIGHSADNTSAGSSLFVMKQNFGGGVSPSIGSRDRLFLPWYLAYRRSRKGSETFAQILREELTKAIPGWSFPIRSAPLAILSSATMPSLLLEVGNINNPINAQSIADAAFQNRLTAAITDAVQRFAESQPTAGN